MYKLKDEYLTYASVYNTDEDIIEELQELLPDKGENIDLIENCSGKGYAYVNGDLVTFEEHFCTYLKFKVYEEM